LARDALFARHSVSVKGGRVDQVSRRGRRWEVLLAGGELLHADAVVIAVGGVAAGGIVLESHARQTSHASFRLSLSAPVELFIKQKRLENVASAHGFDFAAHGVGILEHVGARPRPGEDGLYLAGDVMAGRPNTVLAAVEMGVAAADEICCHGGTAKSVLG
jgi:predicted NAD/FAD-dependent oxidoreductase